MAALPVDLRFLDLAVDLAREVLHLHPAHPAAVAADAPAPTPGSPAATAVVAVRDGKVLTRIAVPRTSPGPVAVITSRSAWLSHPEAAALASTDPAAGRGPDLFIATLDPAGDPLAARPCPSCWAYAQDRAVPAMAYTTGTGAAVERVLRRPFPPVAVRGDGLLRLVPGA